jgi:mono/diheme cytochrome c family protein
MKLLRKTRLFVGIVAFGVSAHAFAQGMAAPAKSFPPEQVKRGEYLARAGDCTSCHTKPNGGKPFAGGFTLGTPFGNLVTPNITPDVETGIGTWTSDDFYRALHDGVSKRVGDLYPAMPYTFYTKVTREDSDAIYAYLMSLEPVRNQVVVNQLRWPFDMRWTLIGWRELYFIEGTYKPDPAWGPEWNRGAYLVEGLGHCSACHSPRNFMGGIEKDKAFTGAELTDGWFALNLTENWKTGLGQWSVDDIVTYLKNGFLKRKSTSLGDMREVVHNSMSYMTDADLRAIATYLKTIPANTSSLAEAQKTLPVSKAGALDYARYCAGCHQAKGVGIAGIFPPLKGNGAVVAAEPDNIIKVVLGGVPARSGYVHMPAWAPTLTDQQIADIANYIRTSWGNSAPANATPQMVEQFRKQFAAQQPKTAGTR